MPHLRSHPGKRARNPSRPLDLPVGFSASCYPKSVVVPEGPVTQERTKGRESPQQKKQKHLEDDDTCTVLRTLLDSVGLIDYLPQLQSAGCIGASDVLHMGDAGLTEAGMGKIVHRRKLLNAARTMLSVESIQQEILHSGLAPLKGTLPTMMPPSYTDDQPPALLCDDADEIDAPPPLLEETGDSQI